MIKIDLKMSKKSTMEVKQYAKLMESGIFAGMKRAMFFAEAESKKSFIENHKGAAHSSKLTARTGHLRRSVQSQVRRKTGLIIGSLGSSVKYARIHELGGVIRAKGKGWLSFRIGKHFIKVKQVTIPARPYLKPAIESNLKKINDIIGKEIERQF